MKKNNRFFRLLPLIALVFGTAFCANKALWGDITSISRGIYAAISVLLYVFMLCLPFISMRMKGKQITFKEYIKDLMDAS
ncbi:MAG: hypothetical protein K2H04_04985 [Bacteroidaceae bacterium]|nr:hypothetical protein [Bacteroidaceae bacterium]